MERREDRQTLMASQDPDARFLSVLSHDLRGGLHSVQLAMDMLRGDVLDSVPMEQLLGDVELARKSLVEAGARTERIICARRMDRGVMPVRIVEADVIPAIQAAVRVTSLAEEDAAARVHLSLVPTAVLQTDARLAGELVGGLLDYLLREVTGSTIRLTLDAGGLLEIAVDRDWITPRVSATLPAATNDPPFAEPTLGLYVAGAAARLLGTVIQTAADHSLTVSLRGQSQAGPLHAGQSHSRGA